MKDERTIQTEIKAVEDNTFQKIERVLNQCDYNGQDMIASFVASLCDVDVADMLSVSNDRYISMSRALYWYALRYYTHDSYQRISERTKIDGHCFNKDGIGIAITKISSVLETDALWRKRWIMIRRMIRLLCDAHDYPLSDFANPMPQKYKIYLQVPKGDKDNFEVEITEAK